MIDRQRTESDTTVLKDAEDALRRGENHFRDIVENASVWIWETDRDLRHVYTNLFVSACLGYQPEEFLAADIFALVHPEDHATLKEVVRRAATERKGWNGVVLRWRHKDGSWRHIESSGTAISDARGNLLGLRGVDHDITERKKAEEALRRSEAMLRQSQRVAGIGHYVFDITSGAWTSSEMLDSIFGIGPDYGRTVEGWLRIVHPDQRSEMSEYLRDHTLRDHLPFDKEYRIIRISDQASRWVHGLGNLEFGPDGKLEKMFGTIQDITERRQAQEALRDSEERLNTILDNVGAYIFIKDAHYRYTYVNRKVCDLFGREARDIVGRGDDAFFSHASAEEIMQSDHPVIERGETVTREETELVSSNNLPRTYWTVKIPMRDNNGNISGLCGISTDITERKNAEEALRESQAQLDLALRSARMGVWHFDIIRNKRKFDDQTCLLLGINRATFTGSAEEFFGAVHPDDRESVRAALARTIEQDTLYEPEYRTVWPDGSVRYITARGRLVRDDKGRPAGINGILWDVTDRKETEERIRASEKKFSAIFSLIPDPTTITDIETGRIIELNEAAAEWFGRPSQALIGMTTADLQVWADLSDRDRMLREMKSEGETNDMEFRLKKHNGEVRDVLLSSRIIEIGRQRYLLSRVHDITEVKRAEQEKLELERQLIQAQRMEGLGVLAGGIAHDFNNLLQGIFGYISMAKITIDQREKSLAMLEQAEQALHQSVSLSSQLLTFSKGGKPVKKKLELKPVIENAVKFALSGSRVDYDLDVDAHLRWVEADEGQIGQVIQNLVINADQAMPMGGRVIITARNVEAPGEHKAALLHHGNYVQISVQDSGIGMPSQYLERIFDPYFTTKEKGSGLGLAISYSIISNHGGTIDVASEIGRGSTLSVYLPATDEAAAGTPASVEADRKARKGKILLMDDESVVRKVAAEMIKALGHEVECAEHGDQTLGMFLQARQQGTPFDVVILDLTIRGGLGGAETIRKLLEIDPGVKAVVSSGYADNGIIADYRSYGFCASLSKPYKIETLRNTLNSLLMP